MAQQFDVSLKLLFRDSKGLIARAVFGAPVTEWLNVELPKVENRRMDMLARTAEGKLVHLELQSYNDANIGLRVVDYYIVSLRLLGEEVEPVVLYVGKEPLRMTEIFTTKRLTFRFRILDIRDFDGEPLINSDDITDNMFALLTHEDKERVINRVMQQIATLDPGEQNRASTVFMILSGLRDLEPLVQKQMERGMVIDLMQNRVLGPMIQEKLDESERKGKEEGKQEGLRLGEATVLKAILQARFGPLPSAVSSRIDEGSDTQLVEWATRVVSAATIEEALS